MQLTDTMLAGINFVRVHGKLYTISLNCTVFEVGDLVLDRQDGTYAVIDMFHDNEVALRDGSAIEVGVSIDRLVKLEPVQ